MNEPLRVSKRPEITVMDAAASVPRVAAAKLLEAIRSSIARTGRCRLGICGGSTPGPILARLSDQLTPAETAALWVTWVDERHPEASNQALADDAWLRGVRPAMVLPMVSGGSLADDTSAFASAFAEHFDDGLDVALLGVGPDGHIASLFPGHEALDSPDAVVGVADSPKPPPTRITLTMRVLNACDAVLVAAVGRGKADALAWGFAHRTPIGMLSPPGRYDWVIDTAAAANLPVEESE